MNEMTGINAGAPRDNRRSNARHALMEQLLHQSGCGPGP